MGWEKLRVAEMGGKWEKKWEFPFNFGVGRSPPWKRQGEKWEFPFNLGFGEAPGCGNRGKIGNFTRVLDGEKPPLEGKDKNGNFQI